MQFKFGLILNCDNIPLKFTVLRNVYSMVFMAVCLFHLKFFFFLLFPPKRISAGEPQMSINVRTKTDLV